MALVIKVLGVGCAKCLQAEKNARLAVEEMGIDAVVEKVDDLAKIIEYGVLATPGLVINDEVIKYGSIPTVKEIKTILSAY